MKKANQLKFLICSLLVASTSAKIVFSGNASSGNSNSNPSTAGKVDVGPASRSVKVECKRGNAVSYGFLKTVLLGGTPEYTLADGKINIDLPTRVSACISNIDAEAIANPVDNNIYLKFNVEIDSSIYPAGNDSIEKEYEKCMTHLSEGNSSFFKVENLKDKGFLVPPESFKINQPNIDTSKNSELVIASTNKDMDYRNDMPFGLASVATNTTFSDSAFNCMDFARPKEVKVMANKTEEYKLREEAIAACNGKNLTDIAQSLTNLRKSSGGNYDDLTRLLSGIQHSLIEEEVATLVERMEEIERDITPSAEDIENGDEYGVGRDKKKELLKEYASKMKEFSKEILPTLRGELEHLIAEFDELGESKEDEKRKSEIQDKIADINDLIAKFNRQNENGAEYKLIIAALREENMQSSGKAVLTGIINAQQYSNVKIEGANKRTVEKADSNVKKEVANLDRGTLADWGDEALLRAGDKSPLERRKKIIQGIQQRASKDYQKQQQKLSAYDEYIQQYAQDLVSSYCTSGGNYQDCMTVQNTYVPYIYNQYSGWKQDSMSEYSNYYNNKYKSAISEQQSTLTRFNSIYSAAQLNQLQNQLNNSSSGSSFDLWTGDSSASYTTGIPGFNFDLSGLGSTNSGWSAQQNNFNIMGNQNRTPSSGSWSNPWGN